MKQSFESQLRSSTMIVQAKNSVTNLSLRDAAEIPLAAHSRSALVPERSLGPLMRCIARDSHFATQLQHGPLSLNQQETRADPELSGLTKLLLHDDHQPLSSPVICSGTLWK
jgi:hypothetical protein